MRNCHSGKKAYTDGVALTYEEDRKVERIWQAEQAYMEKVVHSLPEGSRILDIPVGTGRFLEFYQEQRNQVVGVDISQSMLAEARKKIVSPLINLELGDAEALPYSDGSFDYVVCWRLLHLVQHDVLRTVISELARVSSRKLYLQAYVRDGRFFLLKIKTLFLRIIHHFKNRNHLEPLPWSHIQSFAHDEQLLLQIFSEFSLVVRSVDFLGDYGPLSVKVYVLEKVSSK